MKLTERQREVACLLGRGKRPKQVAAVLGISKETVKVHVRLIGTALEPLFPTHPVRDRIVLYYHLHLKDAP